VKYTRHRKTNTMISLNLEFERVELLRVESKTVVTRTQGREERGKEGCWLRGTKFQLGRRIRLWGSIAQHVTIVIIVHNNVLYI
jgi:hypothetical protein